jgi:FkbM family methyltransferase
MAAGARRMLGERGTRALYRSPAMRPLRRLLASSAPGDPHLVEVCGGLLCGFRMHVDLACEKYYWLGTHEEPVQRALMAHARPGGVAWDIGAHVGFFSLLLSRAVSTTGRVVTFEPHAQNVERLRANVAANDAWNIEVRGVALGGLVGDARFSVHASSLQGALEACSPTERAGLIKVATTTIDRVVSEGATPPDLVKIDVEGAEGQVIRGGRETIATNRPTMVIEIHSRQAWGEVLDALPVAYRFSDIDSGRDPARREPGHYLALPVIAR